MIRYALMSLSALTLVFMAIPAQLFIIAFIPGTLGVTLAVMFAVCSCLAGFGLVSLGYAIRDYRTRVSNRHLRGRHKADRL